MKKIIAIALTLGVLAAACGEAATDDTGAPRDGLVAEQPVGDNADPTVPAEPPVTDPGNTAVGSDQRGDDDPVERESDLGEDAGDDTEDDTVETGHDEPPSGPVTATPVEPGKASGIVDLAVADLAGLLSVEESAVEVVSVEAVVWPDGSLGCPQPGMAYTQVQTDGARIILEHDGRQYAYHSGGGRDPFLCKKG